METIFRECKLIIFNENEIKSLTDLKYGDNAMDWDMEKRIRKLDDEYSTSVIVATMGEKGCMVGYDGDIITVPAERVAEIKDAVGAGDAFTAGFLHSYLKKEKLEDCARYGNLVGAQCVQHNGARGFELPPEIIQ